MIKEYATTFANVSNVSFIVDDDKDFNWLSKKDLQKFERFVVAIDSNVSKEWWGKIEQQLSKHKKEVVKLEIEASEYAKSTAFYLKLLKLFEDTKVNLSDLVIAVGGGAVLDLVSFSCSTYMRGLPMAMIPTTLIGQTDASTAGKTCLNTADHKNILGTFYYPIFVYNNINILESNKPYYSRQGMSEIFKYGLLGSKKLLELQSEYLKTNSKAALINMILETIRVRVSIRQNHPQASNLGHTFGYAIEHMSDFKVLHGDAINMGTVMALYFGLEEGITTKEVVDSILSKMKENRLNVYIDRDLDPDVFVDFMMSDKKSTTTHLNLVMLRDIGDPYKEGEYPFYKVSPDKVRNFVKKFLREYEYAVVDGIKHAQEPTLLY